MVWIPNAIHITTVDGEKHFFASFGARDRAFEVMSTVWRAVLEAEAEKEVGHEAREDEAEPKSEDNTSSLVKVPSSSSLTESEGKKDEIGSTDNGDKGDKIKQVVTTTTIEQSSTSTTTSFSCSSKLSNAEMWSIVKDMYGDNLGLSVHEEVQLSGGTLTSSANSTVNTEKAPVTTSSSSLTTVASSADENEGLTFRFLLNCQF